MLSDMTSVLKRDAPPAGAGQYNDAPDDTPFFAAPAVAPFAPLSALSRCLGKEEVETWDSPAGSVFLAWYSGCLIDHGRRVLRKARDAFGPDMRLAAKVSGVNPPMFPDFMFYYYLAVICACDTKRMNVCRMHTHTAMLLV